MSWSHLRRMAANILIMRLCHRRALGLYMMQHPKSLTLCWHSVDTVLMLCWRSVVPLLTRYWRSVDTCFEGQRYRHRPYCLYRLPILRLCINAVAQPLDYTRCNTKSLTLCWRSFSEWGCDHVAITFAHNCCQNDDYGYLPQQSPWIIEDAIPKIVDTLLTLCWRSVDALLTLCWRLVDAHLVV
jgi:hypothetical protein